MLFLTIAVRSKCSFWTAHFDGFNAEPLVKIRMFCFPALEQDTTQENRSLPHSPRWNNVVSTNNLPPRVTLKTFALADSHLLNHQVSKRSSCSSSIRLHSKLLLSHRPSTISIRRISLWTKNMMQGRFKRSVAWKVSSELYVWGVTSGRPPRSGELTIAPAKCCSLTV